MAVYYILSGLLGPYSVGSELCVIISCDMIHLTCPLANHVHPNLVSKLVLGNLSLNL